MKDMIAEMNQPVFESILDFIMATKEGDQLQTGILCAGGVNSSEHSRSCSLLADYLQDRCCIVASLNGRDLGPGKGSCQAANEKICGQFVGPEANCGDISSLIEYDQRLDCKVGWMELSWSRVVVCW